MPCAPRWIPFSLLLGTLALAAGCGSAEQHPNLILVVVDTLRADHMSLHGYPRKTTPNIDHWAAGGTVFEKTSSACSWTLPSMNMLLTGQTRVRNSGHMGAGQRPLASILQEGGYRTGAVVANPLLTQELRPADGQQGFGFDRGFEYYELAPKPKERHEHNGWSARKVVGSGLTWLEDRDERPFFLFLHLFDPHFPYEPHGGVPFEPWADADREAAFHAALPPEHRELFTPEVYENIEHQIAFYDTEILQMDRALARLFDYLEREGLTDETIVALTADHGEGLWQRAATPGEKLSASAYFPQLYFDHGVQLYSEQVHVPWVMRGPGVPAGRRVDVGVSLLDFVPTVLHLLELPPPAGLDGVNLTPLDALLPRPIFSVCSRGTSLTVEDRWRLHQPRDYRVEQWSAQPELYDLAQDPLELQPLAAPDRIAAMSRYIASHRERHLRREEGLQPLSAKQVEDMAGLGYTGAAEER